MVFKKVHKKNTDAVANGKPKAKRVAFRNQIPTIKSAKGKLFVCGTGDCSQLGLGEDILEKKRPGEIKLDDGVNFVDIVAGGLHNLASTSTNELYTFGCNDDKALGRDGDEFTPKKLPFVADGDIVQLAAGDSFSACLTSKGSVYGWGTFRTSTGELGFVNKIDFKQDKPIKLNFGHKVEITQIACGNNHLLALASDGKVYVVGDNEAGQLGLVFYTFRENSVKEQWLNPKVLSLKKIVYVAAGGYHNLAINDANEVFVWGQNNYFQCGIPDSHGKLVEKIAVPVKSESLTKISKEDRIVKIVGGEHHTLFLTTSGTLYGVGRTDSCQLGVNLSTKSLIQTDDGRTVAKDPIKVSENLRFSDVSTGSNHTFAISNDRVFSWGFGETLALGHGIEEDQETPKEVQNLSNCIMTSAGGQHTLFLVKS